MLDGYLNSDEAAAYLGITRRTLYNLAQTSQGFPQPLRVVRTLLWPIAALDAWRAQHPARRKRRATPVTDEPDGTTATERAQDGRRDG
jgi:predicted DNA-binding transcriptional regulator AlpA